MGRVYVAGAPGGVLGADTARCGRGQLSAPPHAADGGLAPGHRAMAGNHATGRILAGYLYSANIAGGGLGGLFAAFYLLRVFDMAIGTWPPEQSTSPSPRSARRPFADQPRPAAAARSRPSPPRAPRTGARSTPPSASPAFPHWARKWSGRGCCRSCWAGPSTPSPSSSRSS